MRQAVLHFLVLGALAALFVVPRLPVPSAQARNLSFQDTVWTTWQEANKATRKAVDANDLAEAKRAAEAATALYLNKSADFNPATHLILLENAMNIILGQPVRYSSFIDFIHDQLTASFEKSADQPEKFVELGLVYGRLISTKGAQTSDKAYYKKHAKLLQAIEDHAAELSNGSSEEFLNARYYKILTQRPYKSDRKTKKALRVLLDEALIFGKTTPTLNALISLSGIMAIQDKDYDDTLALIKTTIDTLGTEKLSPNASNNLYQVVAAALFLDYGPEKAESMLATVPMLKSLPYRVGTDGEVQIQPVLRFTPNFRNVRKRFVVALEYDVNREGRPENFTMLSTGVSRNRKLEAIEALKRWRYLPEFKDGKFQAVENVRVAFTVMPP